VLNEPLDLDPAWAWSSYVPDASRPWTAELAAHLWRRAAFAPNAQQLQEAVAAGPAETLERLLNGGPDTEAFYKESKSTVGPLLASGNIQNLPAWWLYQMLHTPHPLLEKTTLFWHGHFATSAAKVDKVDLMHRQNALLRRHALSRFGPLLHEAAKDVAMLLWLDSATNHKLQPNENFAREVMELFSLGLGNYTERDIKGAARAFTGWEVRRGQFLFNRPQHDLGEKTVLGRTAKFDGDQIIDLLLEQPATGRFIVRKLLRFFVSDTAELSDRLVEPLAREFREHNYDMPWLLRRMLGSNLFFSPHALRQKVKSPIDLAIGLLRSLEGTANLYALADDLRDLGHGVFFPPNVKGWDGGVEWINSASLLSRANLVWNLVSGTDGRYKKKVPLVELAARAGGDSNQNARWFADLLLAQRLPDEVYVQLAAVASGTGDASVDEHRRLARLVQAIATLPEFQLM
jgi:uncharacterized protein (DUF1800 family)